MWLVLIASSIAPIWPTVGPAVKSISKKVSRSTFSIGGSSKNSRKYHERIGDEIEMPSTTSPQDINYSNKTASSGFVPDKEKVITVTKDTTITAERNSPNMAATPASAPRSRDGLTEDNDVYWSSIVRRDWI